MNEFQVLKLRKLLRKYEKIFKIPEKNSKKIGKIFRKFCITFEDSRIKYVEFQKKFRERLKVKHQNYKIIKSGLSRNHRHRYFEKILRKT